VQNPNPFSTISILGFDGLRVVRFTGCSNGFLRVTTKKERHHNHLSSTLSYKEEKQIAHNHEISKKKNILLIEREREHGPQEKEWYS